MVNFSYCSQTCHFFIYISGISVYLLVSEILNCIIIIADPLPDQKVKRIRCKKKPIELSYHKWAHSGVPMLISAGDDAKLYAYSAKEFTEFAPHDICPAPQRVPIQLVLNTVFNQSSLLLVQASCWLDILCIRVKNGACPISASGPGPSGGLVATDLLFRVKSKASRRIICSTMSNSGMLFSYSDHAKPVLYELKRKGAKTAWTLDKRLLPRKLPYAHSMVFSFDSARLIMAGHDRRIYVSCLFVPLFSLFMYGFELFI